MEIDPQAQPLATRRGVPALVLAIVAAQLILAGWLAWRLSFVFAGERYFCLFDDAMISMTYARNLSEGHGLNWARFGPPVEGFSHPLWLGFMIAANLLPLPLRWRGLPIEALSAVLLAATVLAAWSASRRHFTSALPGSWLPAVGLIAFYQPLLAWSVLGMESALQALLSVLALQLALDITESGRDRHLALWAVLAAACLLRMDMVLLVVVIEAHVLLFARPLSQGAQGSRRPRRSWLRGLGLFAALTGAYAAFRLAYFHDWLPNTYYLKLYGIPLLPRMLRGLAVARDTLPGLAFPLGLGIAGALFAGRRRPLLLALAIFGVYFLYSIEVGGDAFEGVARANRFVNFAAPALFLAAGAALDRMRVRALAARPFPRAADLGGLGVVTLLLVLAVNGLGRDPAAWRAYLLIDKPLFARRYEKNLARLGRLERLARPGALIATVWAGLPPFYSDFRFLDLLGYNDRVIARLPPAEPLTTENFAAYEPGHEKWSYPESLARHPDAFLSAWSPDTARTDALLARSGYVNVAGFWLRCGSPWIDWRQAGMQHGSPPC
jgi:hypothetical protein